MYLISMLQGPLEDNKCMYVFSKTSIGNVYNLCSEYHRLQQHSNMRRTNNIPSPIFDCLCAWCGGRILPLCFRSTQSYTTITKCDLACNENLTKRGVEYVAQYWHPAQASIYYHDEMYCYTPSWHTNRIRNVAPVNMSQFTNGILCLIQIRDPRCRGDLTSKELGVPIERGVGGRNHPARLDPVQDMVYKYCTSNMVCNSHPIVPVFPYCMLISPRPSVPPWLALSICCYENEPSDVKRMSRKCAIELRYFEEHFRVRTNTAVSCPLRHGSAFYVNIRHNTYLRQRPQLRGTYYSRPSEVCRSPTEVMIDSYATLTDWRPSYEPLCIELRNYMMMYVCSQFYLQCNVVCDSKRHERSTGGLYGLVWIRCEVRRGSTTPLNVWADTPPDAPDHTPIVTSRSDVISSLVMNSNLTELCVILYIIHSIGLLSVPFDVFSNVPSLGHSCNNVRSKYNRSSAIVLYLTRYNKVGSSNTSFDAIINEPTMGLSCNNVWSRYKHSGVIFEYLPQNDKMCNVCITEHLDVNDQNLGKYIWVLVRCTRTTWHGDVNEYRTPPRSIVGEVHTHYSSRYTCDGGNEPYGNSRSICLDIYRTGIHVDSVFYDALITKTVPPFLLDKVMTAAIDVTWTKQHARDAADTRNNRTFASYRPTMAYERLLSRCGDHRSRGSIRKSRYELCIDVGKHRLLAWSMNPRMIGHEQCTARKLCLRTIGNRYSARVGAVEGNKLDLPTGLYMEVMRLYLCVNVCCIHVMFSLAVLLKYTSVHEKKSYYK